MTNGKVLAEKINFAIFKLPHLHHPQFNIKDEFYKLKGGIIFAHIQLVLLLPNIEAACAM